MHVFYNNVNDALPALAKKVAMEGVKEGSRNGEVIALQEPIIVTTISPKKRVLLCPERRINPFMFLVDGLSILAPCDEVAPYLHFTPRMKEFSDNGVDLRGHYGFRLRHGLPIAIQMLREQPGSRRAYLPIYWDSDVGAESRDIPCNVGVMLRVVQWSLEITVINRSNDLFWGMLGANTVQFSFLQQHVAEELHLHMGAMHQISNNLHIYLNQGPGLKKFPDSRFYPHERQWNLGPSIKEDVYHAMRTLAQHPPSALIGQNFVSPFMQKVFVPMMEAWSRKTAKFLPHNESAWFEAARMYFKEV